MDQRIISIWSRLNKKIKKMAPRDQIDMVPALESTILVTKGNTTCNSTPHEVRHVQNGLGVHIDMNPFNKKIKDGAPGFISI
jgi:hypothetical protein